MQGGTSLEERFRQQLEELGLARAGTPVLVALSGGSDSVVLLHLLRFSAAELGIEVRAAHFDHAMRPGSEADARWVEGLCRAWGIPLLRERADRPLRGEEEARRARYAFLRTAAAEFGAARIATAHHADDQAETVLFRVLRGTGVAGLGGIAPSAAGLVRPLLPFWREDLRRYGRRAGLRWREDPTNLGTDAARNRIRLHLLPLVERTVAPGARRSLVRLAELARQEEAAWSALLGAAERAATWREGEAVVLAREVVRGYDSPVASRILRRVLRQFGVVLDRTGTRLALQFISQAPSGRAFPLPGGLRLATEFETVRVERVRELPPDEPLSIPGEPDGEGRARLGGRVLRAAWRTAPLEDAPVEGAALAREGLRFPLLLRGWRPGDRIRTAVGTKTLKKLFGERRVPRSERARTPVLVDADETVLWVAGVELASGVSPHPGQTALFLSISDD
jgi:tRNA(Ile)-lysidine synthase